MNIAGSDTTLKQLADVLWRGAQEIPITASNLANVDTPGYRAMQVEFQDSLRSVERQELARSDERHIEAGEPRPRLMISEAPGGRLRPDGNNVDVDREMSRLAVQQGRYNTAVRLIRKRFALMEYAANDGR